MTSRPTSAAPLLAALAVVLVTLGTYLAGYFWLGKRSDFYSSDNFLLPPSKIDRQYSQMWMAMIFRPAEWIEEKLRGVDAEVMWFEPYAPSTPAVSPAVTPPTRIKMPP
jgi:hypothetical protein